MAVCRRPEGSHLELRQSHGWVDGTLLGDSFEQIAAHYVAADQSTWPRVTAAGGLKWVDR